MMRHLNVFSVAGWACVCLLLAGVGVAAELVPDHRADHEALRKLREVYERAVNEVSPYLLRPHLARGFTGVMVTGEQVEGYDGVVNYWQHIHDLIGPRGKYQTHVTVAGPSEIIGDVAVAHGTSDDQLTTDSGRVFRFTTRWTAVCRREDGQWKIARVHGSMDPVTNVFVAAAVERTGWIAGLAGGGAGLVLGGAATWAWSRRRVSRGKAAGINPGS